MSTAPETIQPLVPSLPLALSGLTPREAVLDALYRAVTSFDTADEQLFNSAFVADGTFEIAGHLMRGRDEIMANSWSRVARMNTSHHVANVRVHFPDGGEGKTAQLTATAMAQHFRPGEGTKGDAPRLLAGTLYAADLIRDDEDGLWKFSKFSVKVLWREGDASVMSG